MKKQDMRHMSRQELVNIILAQKEREAELQTKLDAAEQQLKDREIHLENAGSIAEAALAVNGIFEVAQAAADQYVASVKALNADIAKKLLDAQTEREKILAEAQAEAERIHATQLAKTEQEIQEKWAKFEQHIHNALMLPPEMQTYFKPDADQ